jgi:large subunit ribosomal protein L5
MLPTLKMQKKNQILRCFFYQNVHQLFSKIEKVTLFYSAKKDVSLFLLVRFFSLLALITNERCSLTRSKLSSAFSKNRKGAPVGVKLTLRSYAADCFLSKLIWEILPQIRLFRSDRIKKRRCLVQPVINLSIPDPLLFPSLIDFYFLFRSCINLRITFSFSPSFSSSAFVFHRRIFQIPQ